MTAITAHPLCWPETLPRYGRPRQVSRFQTTLARALANVESSLRLFGKDTGKPVSEVILSSNVTLGRNRPPDPGVAAWFVWEGNQVCIAVDRYLSAEHNLQAIHHIVEARRTGGAARNAGSGQSVVSGFQGAAASPHWSGVLGVERRATRTQIESAYRAKAKTLHPDAGGDADAMAELNRAREATLTVGVE